MITAIKEFYTHRTEYFFYILFLIIASVACLFMLDFFLDYTYDLKEGNLDDFDDRVTEFIYSYRAPAFTSFVIFITELGSQWAYLILIPIITGILFYTRQSWRISLQAFIILLSTFFLNLGIKHLISRPRPLMDGRLVEVSEGSFSYPSGHSMCAMAFYGFNIYLIFKLVKNVWLRWALIISQALLILAIGTSRVYLGVHFPTDVIAGFVAGFVWLILCIAVLRTINFYRKKREPKERLEEI